MSLKKYPKKEGLERPIGFFGSNSEILPFYVLYIRETFNFTHLITSDVLHTIIITCITMQ